MYEAVRFTCVIGLDRDRDRNVSHQHSKETEASALVRRRPDIALRLTPATAPKASCTAEPFLPKPGRRSSTTGWLFNSRTSPATSGPIRTPVARYFESMQRLALPPESGRRRSKPPRRPSTGDCLIATYFLLLTFGNLQLRKIRPREVHDWYDELFALKLPTAAGACRLLATIFNRFVKDNRGFSSPCERAEEPTPRKSDPSLT
jgi:hypothetical protein